jgi:hypothetical protein
MIEGAAYSAANINGPGPLHCHRTPDHELPAKMRALAVAKAHGYALEYQGGPRGWPLTLLAKGRRISPPCRY